MTTSRVGPTPRRARPVACRLRLVTLAEGVAISRVAPSQRKDSGTRYGTPSAGPAVATQASGVVVEPTERVVLALPGSAGGGCHAGSLLKGRVAAGAGGRPAGGGWAARPDPPSQTVSTTLRSSPRPVVAMITSSPACRVKP